MNTFIRKPPQPRPGFDVKTILRRTPVKGDIGLEIECEGNKFEKNDDNLGPYWGYHKDNSLRGKDNAEYVLRKPIPFDEVPLAVGQLWKIMGSYGTVLDVSNRTSVHVHLNCQKFHLNRLASFVALYFIVEEVLTEWCGEHRVGNLFCLRGKDAPGLVSAIKRFIRTDGEVELRDNLHYAGLNANALQKFGSLEIRTLRGVTEPAIILDWVAILRRLYDLSADFKDPRDICAMFSSEGPAHFFDTILGDTANIVRRGVKLTEDQIRDSMYEGIRLAQDICYCRDWSLYDPKELADDPFGRDPRKLAKKLAAGAGQPPMPTTMTGVTDTWATTAPTPPAEMGFTPFTINEDPELPDLPDFDDEEF